LPEGSQEQLRVLMRIKEHQAAVVRYYKYNLKDHAKAEELIKRFGWAD
jgi:hypothetical protein